MLVPAIVERVADQLLGDAQRVGRTVGQLARHLLGLGGELILRHDPVQDVVFLGLLGREALAQQGDLQRLPLAHDPRQEVGRAAIGAEADMAIGQGEERIVGGDGQVAVQDQRQAEARGGALHRGQDRLVHAADLVDRLVRLHDPHLEAREMGLLVLGQRLVEAADVATRHEVRAGAADHHAAHRRVLLELRAVLDQQVAHLHRQRVQRLGPVERHPADAIFDFGENVRCGHGAVSSGVYWTTPQG